MDFFAHVREDGTKQSVKQHLEGTAELAERFGQAFDAGPAARQAGLAHDLGKYSAGFQRRLLDNGPKVDHSTAGAVELIQLSMPMAALAVAGHHGGLPDFLGPEPSSLRSRIQKGLSHREDYSSWQEDIALTAVPEPEFCQKADGFTQAFFARMLYSCLVDADYQDTQQFMDGPQSRGGGASLEVLRDRLLDSIRPWLDQEEDGSLNGLRSHILRSCIAAAEDPAPLRTLTVPTGGGKTIASLAYALCHGAQHKKDRVIYVIPYTSIIEQTAEEFRKRLGDEAVLEHHSAVDYTVQEGEAGDPRIIRKALAAENWDAPIIVTTAVQFFESLFAARSSRCRKLHNIANSVIIFDEAQMIPLSHLRPCTAAIAQLVEHYCVTALLCTATQPALGPLLQEFAPLLSLSELLPDPTALHAPFRRVTFRQLGTLSTEELARQISPHHQMLCIVPTRKQAQEVYAHLDPEGSFHLSTLMPPVQREHVLRQIRARLKDDLPCRVVSTSLIECGVDVDFPVVYRAEAGLDSLLQSAGRCNREGRRSAADSFVYIYSPLEGIPPQFRPQRDACHAVLENFDDLTSPAAIEAYFRTLRSNLGPEAQDKVGVLKAFQQGVDGRLLPFQWVAQQFHLIDDTSRVVYLPIDRESEALIAQLRAGQHSRALFRKLGRYGVNVYDGHFRALYNAGALELVEDQAVLADLTLYRPDVGLTLDPGTGRGIMI